MLTKEEVIKVSKLAKLKLTDQEIEKFTPQLSSIIDYVDKLSQVDVSNVKPTLHTNELVKNQLPSDKSDGMQFPRELGNTYREDVVKESLTIDEVLKNAPIKEGRYIVAKSALIGS